MFEDIYENYNSERYIHYRYVFTGHYEVKEQKRNGKKIPVRKPVFEKQKIDFEAVKNLRLDDIGVDARTCGEDFQLIHNYFFDFWGAILGANAVLVYMHLKRYCYGNRDFCFPDLSTIEAKMGKSRNTIVEALNVLEEYCFVSKILRKDTERNNGDSSPFFKVRRYIPLLTVNLYEQIPEILKKEHDRFIARSQGIVLEESSDTSILFKKMMENAEVMKSSEQKVKEDVLLQQEKHKEYIERYLSEEQHKKNELIHKNLIELVSKPSYDSWFKDSFILFDQKKMVCICNTDLSRDWINKQYNSLVSQIVRNTFNTDPPALESITYHEFLNNLETYS